MTKNRKPIFSGFAPNIRPEEVRMALGFLFLPWRWKKIIHGDAPRRVEAWLRNFFHTEHAWTFDSGRSALFYALRAVGVGVGDEVLVQGYTCIVVSNAIVWAGARPIYVDIDSSLTMDPQELEKKITPQTKAIIVQHTFGQPAQMEKIGEIAKKHGLKVIEDCAHTIGGVHKGKLLGTFGDVGMFSFGSDKVVSCIRGGALITNNPAISQRIEELRSRLPQSDGVKVIQHLLYYPIFFIAKPLYTIFLGKLLLYCANRLHLTARIIYPQEKKGKQMLLYPALLPNALAQIVLNQLDHLEETNNHRRKIAQIYEKEGADLRITKLQEGSVPLFVAAHLPDPYKAVRRLRQKGMHLSLDWTGAPIVPRSADPDCARYREGMCLNAEKISQTILVLPTHKGISEKDAERIITSLCTT